MRAAPVLRLLACCASALCSLPPLAAASADSVVERRIEQVLNEIPPGIIVQGEPTHYSTLLERMAALHVPGVSIAVIHNGSLEWASGFGMTGPGGDPITPDTLLQASSISKPVTALAVLSLVQAGRLDLDRDVNTYLRSWKVPDNSFTAHSKVTLHELLDHTAGVTIEGFLGYRAGDPLPTLRQILNGEPPALGPAVDVSFVPGTQFRYAGGGFLVLRQILTDVTGQPFEQLMQNTVLSPLGMAHSSFQQPLPPDELSRAALPHDRDGQVFDHGARVYPELAPDGLWTTASDLARYIIGVQRSLAGDGFLSPATARLMLTPGLEHWGLGPIIGEDPRHPYFTFSGGNYGFISAFVGYNQGDGAVVMSNAERGGALAIEILRSIARTYQWPDFQPFRRRVVDMDPRSLTALPGGYQLSPDKIIAISRTGSELFMMQTGSTLGRQRLYPLSPDRFLIRETSSQHFPETSETEVAFTTAPDKKAQRIDLFVNGIELPDHAVRMSPGAAQRAIEQLAALAARVERQVPVPGGPEALRQLIDRMADGHPEQLQVGPELARVLQWDRIGNQRFMTGHGSIESIKFLETLPNGFDLYRIVFSRGSGLFGILLGDHGAIEQLTVRLN
jgi:CubicO group peptidase (beta-lactamase class C family)